MSVLGVPMLLTCQACSCACGARQLHENKRCAFTAQASKALAADTEKRNKSLKLQATIGSGVVLPFLFYLLEHTLTAI
jgi:hypothetical protein